MPNGYQGGYDPQFDPNYDPYADPQMTDPNMSGGDPYADPQGGGYADHTQPPAVDHNATILEMQQQVALLQAQLAQKDQQAQQQAMTDQERQLEEAQKMLGVDQILKQQEQMLAQLEEQKRAVELQAIKDRNPDFDEKLVQKELEKIRETNPELAESMSRNPAGLELVFKSIKANAVAQGTPDKMTGNRYGGGQANNTARKVAEGKASEMELGSYLLGLK